ncbi:hypothetical protein LINGRAHAP2_LOCUS31501, partial [Linum grandiflorum]
LWIAAFLSSTLDLCSISRSEIASTTPSFQLVTELDYRSKELSSSVQDLSDGHSATRPPRFEGAHFGFWKNQMDLIIQSFYPTLWEIITYRPLDVEKKHGKWTKEEKEKVQLNAQAMNIMYCSLGHFKVDCPQTRREKAFHAAWGGSETEESDEETAFMAIADLDKEPSQEADPKTNTLKSSEVCLQTTLDEAEWVLDSGCSHHMTGNKYLFYSFQDKEKGKVSFGDNRSCKILGFGQI